MPTPFDAVMEPVVAVPLDLPAVTAARLLALAPDSALIVSGERGLPIGIVAVPQILRFLGASSAPSLHPAVMGVFQRRAAGVSVAEIMEAVTLVPIGASRAAVARAFMESGLSHLPMIDDEGVPVRMLSREEFIAGRASASGRRAEGVIRDGG